MVGAAHAWKVKTNSSGNELGWADPEIGYVLNPDGDHGLDPLGVELAVTSAAESWERVPGIDLRFDYEGQTATREQANGDGENLVYFEDDWGDLGDSLLAVTYVYSNAQTGEILDFDMAVNLDYPWSTTGENDAYDLQNSITHEFGHAVGLDHSKDGDATMYGSTYKGETDKRTLEVDDEQAARYLYGLDGWTEPQQMGCDSSGTRGDALTALIGVLLALGLMRRRGGSDSPVEG